MAAGAVAEPAPNGRFANSGPTTGSCNADPQPGLLIDAHNVAEYQCLLPWGAIEAVKHGFKIRIAGTHKIDWPAGFKQATEKYGPQVRLDGEDNLSNYIAGMPFPLVDITDPKAARKIAYNWHMGPFMPDDFSLTPWGSFAYADSGNGTAQPIRGEPDYTFICNQFDFLRFAHRTEIDPRPTLGENSQGFEWKARCGGWSSTGTIEHAGKTIWLRYLDPHRSDEDFVFDEGSRRATRIDLPTQYLDHQCRSCHQPYWAYALPKTEAYIYRLLGTTPILACLTANEEPAGFVGRDAAESSDLLTGADGIALGEEPFEMRSAYIIEMVPSDSNYSNLRALVWIDTETYVWLGAEFFESNIKTQLPALQEVAVPLWRTRPAPEGGSLFDLAGSFYMPLAYEPALSAHPSPSNSTRGPRFFRSVVPSHGPYDQKINQGTADEAMFNPRSLGN